MTEEFSVEPRVRLLLLGNDLDVAQRYMSLLSLLSMVSATSKPYDDQLLLSMAYVAIVRQVFQRGWIRIVECSSNDFK